MKLYHGSNVSIEVIDLSKSLKSITFQYYFGTEAAVKTLHKL